MTTFDTLVRGGTVVTGRPEAAPLRADIAIREGVIVDIGSFDPLEAAEVIDASDHLVVPGFIDVHTHIETALLDGPHRYAAARMGVTTVLSGPDGFGWTGLGRRQAREMWEATAFSHGSTRLPTVWETPEDYLREFEDRLPIHVVPQAPHNEIRLAALGWESTQANDARIPEQVERLERWFQAGAVGLCMGLDYQPGAFAAYGELAALAAATARMGGVVAAHVRYAALGRAGAWDELVRLHRDTGVKVHVSHEVVDEITRPILDLCDSEGIDLTFEAYAYPAGCTHLCMMLPLELQEGPPERVRSRLQEPRTREKARRHLTDAFSKAMAQGERIVVVATPTGTRVGEDLTGLPDPHEAAESAIDLIVEAHPYVLSLYHRGWTDEKRLEIFRETVTHPRMMVASDGVYHGAMGHPRSYGCFPAFLRRFALEAKWLTVSEAVYKMSGMPADRFGIPDRGYLEPGRVADLAIVRPERLTDRASWSEPFAPPDGIPHVLVAGATVIRDGEPTNALPGKVIR